MFRRYDAMDDDVKKPAEQVARAAEELAESGKSVERSSRTMSVEAVRQVELAADRNQLAADRTQLAADRTLLAVERTYAAWVRTALAALASGVGARALLHDFVPLWMANLTGSVLIMFAGFCLVAAVWRPISGSVSARASDLKPIPRTLLVPMNLFLLLVAIAALFGIWVA